MELRPLSAADVDDIQELIADPDTLRFTRVPEPPREDFAQDWFARYEQARETGTKEAFAIIGDDGAFLGLALAPSIDAEAAEAELGYIVAAHARGRGVASEALRLLTALGVRGARRPARLPAHRRRQRGVQARSPSGPATARGRDAQHLPQAGPARGHPAVVAPAGRSARHHSSIAGSSEPPSRHWRR